MLKAITTMPNGRRTLMLGLSFRNLDKFRAQPLDTYIPIDGEALGLPIDVLIFSAETEGDLGRFVADRIGPDTKVYIDPKVAT